MVCFDLQLRSELTPELKRTGKFTSYTALRLTVIQPLCPSAVEIM